MMKTLGRITGMLALALLTTHVGRAQEPVLANIPFAFTVGNMTLPAGEYRVEKVRDSSPALLIQRTDRSASMMVIAPRVEANAPQAQTKLVYMAMATSVICHKSGQQAMLEDVSCQNRPKRRSRVGWRATRHLTRSRLLPASSRPSPRASSTTRATPRESGRNPLRIPASFFGLRSRLNSKRG